MANNQTLRAAIARLDEARATARGKGLAVGREGEDRSDSCARGKLPLQLAGFHCVQAHPNRVEVRDK